MNYVFYLKNLYNKANYIVRQEFIKTSKQKEEGLIEHANWINYYQLKKKLQEEKDFDYYKLPTKVSQEVLRSLDKNWKSFFASIKDWKRNPSNYKGKPSLPKYKHKKKGRVLLTYNIQAISKKELKNEIIHLSGTNIRIHSKQKNINIVRIIPKVDSYVIEVVYEKDINNLNLDKNNIAGIDIGLNNLASVTSNINELKPLLINGKPLKSINQYYNKKKAYLQSFVGERSSRRLRKLVNKRNKKIDNYLHNASRVLINYFILNNIGTIVIGKNKQWKNKINIGKRNNQAFVNIPHSRFIEMINYKCFLVGITVIFTEESYTSKCSFIDLESMEHHDTYLGKKKTSWLIYIFK